MANLTKPAGYPYALKAPFPHDDLNDICEQFSKAPNADDGSAHAPTGDIEWSGAGGGGFSFDTADPFPFFGYLDVSSGLRFTAPVSGQVRINSTVAIDIFSTNMTLQSGALLTLASGAQISVSSGATVTHASGSTTNLTGAVNVRGTVTFKTTANGGPGIASWEGTGAELNGTAGAVGAWAGTWTFSNGLVVQTAALNANGGLTATTLTVSSTATFNDPVTINDRVTFSGTGAYRVLRASVGPDSSSTVNLWEADVWTTAPITSNRLWTLATPPSNAPFMAIVALGPGTGGLTLTLGTVNGGTVFLNAGTPHYAAIVVYDGANYSAVVGAV